HQIAGSSPAMAVCRSRPQPFVLRIVDRLLRDRRLVALAEDLDLQLGARCRQVLAHIGERDALADAVAVAAGADDADLRVAVEDDRAGQRIRGWRLHDQRHEALDLAFAVAFEQRLLADEVALLQLHETLEAGIEGRVFMGDVLLPRTVALFEAQALHRIHAEIADAERLARL